MQLSVQIKHLKRFLKQEVSHSKRILDIGCGDGSTALYLISSLHCAVQGIDLDAGRIHRANEKFKRKARRGFAVCSILEAQDMRRTFFEKPFNAVIITHSFHHLANIGKVLRKAKSVLANDGKIIIAEYTNSFGETMDDCPRFAARKIKLLARNAGFKKLKKCNLSHGLFAIVGYKN
ncbi:MAG: class I SAM-dependent methyltransferase [bacterium]|nr:class I SAM-dependent methyltransferase [bacterium]